MTMSSSRPYFLRAIYEWIVDNNWTPHILVNARAEGTHVPPQHINKEGQIILNVSPSAVKDLMIDNAFVTFSARFSGIVNHIHIPCGAILGIYAKENGQGMMFEPEPNHPQPPQPPQPPSPTTKSSASVTPIKKPGLRVVK
jgi:stringent starvation protein B